MREIEQLVETYLAVERDLVAAVDVAGGAVPLPDGRTVCTGRAEFDALPNIGHGCGHNLIGPSAVGAGLALAAVAQYLPGSVILLGTPAEESTVDNSGGKVHMVNAGVFSDLEIVGFGAPGGTPVQDDDLASVRGPAVEIHRGARSCGPSQIARLNFGGMSANGGSYQLNSPWSRNGEKQ